MSVLRFERYPVQPDRMTEFEELVAGLLDGMREAAGNLWADAAKAFDDEPSYILLSEWRTEADLRAWEESGAPSSFRDGCDIHLRGEVTQRLFSGG